MKQFVARITCLILLIFLSLPSFAIAAEQFSITLKPKVTGDYTVDVEVETDLPDGVILDICLWLADLSDDDMGIGTDPVEAVVKKGKAIAKIDAKALAAPSIDFLVSGKYQIEANLYEWRESNHVVEDTEGIEAHATIEMKMNGKSKENIEPALKKVRDQRWIRHNVYTDMEWDSNFWLKKFGVYKVLEPTAHNPKIISFFYFPEIDITLMVNRNSNQIITYREGMATE